MKKLILVLFGLTLILNINGQALDKPVPLTTLRRKELTI
jgi:hypothetical protein